MLAVDTQFQLAHHHFDRDHRVVDEEAERNDQGAQRDALQTDAGILHVDKDHAEHERDRAGDDHSGAQSKAQETDPEHDCDRFPQSLGEAADGFLDHDGLIGDQMRLDADRQLRGNLRHLVRYSLAKDEVVAALCHRDREANRRLAVKSEHRLWRIGIAFPDCRHIGEPEKFAVGEEIHMLQIVNRAECAGNPNREFLQTGLDDAGWCDRVLLL